MKNIEHRAVEGAQQVEQAPGVVRTTLCYNEEMLLCHFAASKGAVIPLHHHAAVQSGYVVRGTLEFIKRDGTRFTARAGVGYLFDSEEEHGATVMEDTEFVECFAPMRPEYADR